MQFRAIWEKLKQRRLASEPHGARDIAQPSPFWDSGRRMHVLHYPRRKNYPDYYCKQNRGSDDPIHHHHHVGISVNHLDNLAWEFALPYLQNPKFIREHIEAIKGQVDSQNRIGTLEATLADTK